MFPIGVGPFQYVPMHNKKRKTLGRDNFFFNLN